MSKGKAAATKYPVEPETRSKPSRAIPHNGKTAAGTSEAEPYACVDIGIIDYGVVEFLGVIVRPKDEDPYEALDIRRDLHTYGFPATALELRLRALRELLPLAGNARMIGHNYVLFFNDQSLRKNVQKIVESWNPVSRN